MELLWQEFTPVEFVGLQDTVGRFRTCPIGRDRVPSLLYQVRNRPIIELFLFILNMNIIIGTG